MRSKRAKKRPLESDAIFKSRVVTRMINTLMNDGKKALARNIVYKSISMLDEDRKKAAEIFENAVKNVMPRQEVRSRRVGGATYQVPYPVKHERAEALAVRWLVGVARNKKGKPMYQKLYEELRAADQEIGDAIKKRDETHKMADSNKAFSHFRF